MAKKILIMGVHDAMGGIEQVVYDYVSRIHGNDLNFIFASMHKKIVYQDEYEKMGCKMFVLPDVKKKPLECARALMEIIKREKIDIVHYNMLSAANILPLIVAKIAGCKKIIAHSHSIGTVGLHKYILHYINRIFIPFFANSLFTCSNKAGRFMFGRKKNITLIKNAIDTHKFSYDLAARKKIRDELGISENTPVIGHVGRFAEVKNHSFLIEIFRSIAKKCNTVKLLLVGTGHKETKIRELIKKYELDDKVIFYGTSSKIHELYSAMDIFVFPSLFEGLGVVGAEAQCNGMFVVASDIIPRQMDISGNVKWHNLSNDPPGVWADTVLENLPKRKIENLSGVITAAGYNIEIEAERLRSIYINST